MKPRRDYSSRLYSGYIDEETCVYNPALVRYEPKANYGYVDKAQSQGTLRVFSQEDYDELYL